MSLTTIGVDPGLTGAIAVLVDGEFGDVFDMPVEAKAKKGNQVDCAALFQIAVDIRGRYVTSMRTRIVIEQVSAGGPAMRGRQQGISSAFSFGDSFGCARFFGVLIAEASVDFVRPAQWKQDMKLTNRKEYSLTKARRMFPGARQKLSRKKDDGRAEALLLARWLFDQSKKSKK